LLFPFIAFLLPLLRKIYFFYLLTYYQIARIPRGSDTWKTAMKERTASERVNDRILQDYGIETSHIRSKKRLSFYVALAAVNIHLDAQLKFLVSKKLFDFDNLIFFAQDPSTVITKAA